MALKGNKGGKGGKGVHRPAVARTFSLVALRTVTCVRTRMAQGRMKKVFALCMSCLSTSLSPLSRFTRLHCCSPTDTSTTSSRPSCPHRFCQASADPQARVQRTSVLVRRSLATWPLCSTAQLMCPSSLTRWFLRDDDATPINDPDHESISDFLKTTHENTGWFSVPTVCETSVSQSRGDIALQNENLRKPDLGNLGQAERTGGKRRFCD